MVKFKVLIFFIKLKINILMFVLVFIFLGFVEEGAVFRGVIYFNDFGIS